MNMLRLMTMVLIILLSKFSFCQEKKEIHYLADTSAMTKSNKILEIGFEANIRYYMFYCNCVPPYGQGYNLSFKVGKSKSETSLPKFNFLSWKELLELAMTNYTLFDKKFKFYITEVLPNKQYLTSEVTLVRYKEKIVDLIILPPKQ